MMAWWCWIVYFAGDDDVGVGDDVDVGVGDDVGDGVGDAVDDGIHVIQISSFLVESNFGLVLVPAALLLLSANCYLLIPVGLLLAICWF